MKITFLGAAHEVTGSCILINACGKNLLVDCGMEQGADIYENSELPIKPSDIDAVFLTHSHIDHSGKIPMLCAKGFDGMIYTTSATHKLCGIMLMDSASIQQFEADWRNRKAKRSGEEPYVPLYTAQDVQKTMTQFYDCEYNSNYNLCEGIRFSFTDAGHLLGSASITITITENGTMKRILFSGDIGNTDRPIIRNPSIPDGADFVVMESTYGNRLHGERQDFAKCLSEIIERTLSRGGNLVIPSFAVGRTQELLYIIRKIKQNRMVNCNNDFPVFVDSPLAVEATQIYSSDMCRFYDDETSSLVSRGINPIMFSNLHLSVSSEESMLINNDKTPKVILSASGMCEAGRIRHHLKHNLWRKESTILFVGYQAEGTLGRIITDGKKSVKIFGEEIKVNAEIAGIEGISGHADKNMLLSWLNNQRQKPSKVFINHGNDEVCDEFAALVTEKTGIPAVAPYNGAVYDLLADVCLERGNSEKIRKSDSNPRIKSDGGYKRLVAATQRLVRIIEKCKGLSTKELAKFESQITNLCDKWENR